MTMQTFTEAMGWTLLHTMWQGIIVATILAIGLRVLVSAQARYAAAVAGLAAVLGLAVVTFSQHAQTPAGNAGDSVATSVVPAELTHVRDPSPAPNADTAKSDPAVEPALPLVTATPADVILSSPGWAWERYLVMAWLLGVAFFALRLFYDWRCVRQLEHSACCVQDARWSRRFETLAQRVGATRAVRLLVSATVRVPTALGVLRPVVIVPPSLLSGMDPAKVEAILLHELAHVRRHDYLVNFLQRSVETLLFFHPAVWWISRRIRVEREHCCDDIASEACGDASEYARALADLELACRTGWEGSLPSPALAADGGERRSLVARVRRLLRVDQQPRSNSNWSAALVGGLAILAAAGSFMLLFSGLVRAAGDAEKQIDVGKLWITHFGDKEREIFCIHTPDDILAVMVLSLPEGWTSTESSAGVRRENRRSKFGSAWAKYRWGDSKLEIAFSTRDPAWIRLNKQRLRLEAGRVILWRAGEKLAEQSKTLDGDLPVPRTSDAEFAAKVKALKKQIREKFAVKAVAAKKPDPAAEKKLEAGQMVRLKAGLVHIEGTIVDAESGERIVRPIAMQRGRRRGAEIEWSTHPNGSVITDHGDGTFRAPLYSLNSRVVVGGYLPKNIPVDDLKPDVRVLKVELELTRAPTVSGRVIDHRGQPVAGASVFAIGSMGLNLREGKEWHPIGDRRRGRAAPVTTDAEGKFDGLPIQSNRRLAVSCEVFDAWPAELAEGKNEIEIRLPEAATMRIDFDIPGAPDIAKVRIAALDLGKGWEGLSIKRLIDIERGSVTTFAGLPAGTYHINRFAVPHYTPHEFDWLDQVYVELKPGDVRVLDWTRKGPGARVKGRVTWADDVKDLDRIRLKVASVVPNKHLDGRDVATHLDARVVDLKTGEFRTEKLPLGKYILDVETRQRVGRNREFFGTTRMSGTVRHTEKFSFPFEVKAGAEELDLKELRLDPPKDPRGDALRERDAKRAAAGE